MILIKNYEQGISYTLLSAFCLSLFGLFTKLGLQQPSITFVLFLRFVIPFIILLPLLWYSKSLKNIFPIKSFRNQLLRALSVVISQYCLFYYLTKGTLFNATMLLSIGPVIIPLLAKIFYRHQIKMITWICMVLGFVGVAMILRPSSGIFDVMSIYGLVAGLGAAISQVLYGANVEKEKNSQNLFYFYLFTSILSIIPLAVDAGMEGGQFIPNIESMFADPFKTSFYIILLSLSTVGNQYFRGIAYQHAKPAVLAPFLYATIIYSGVFDWLVFGHAPDFMSFLGSAIVIFASLLQWAWEREKKFF